MILKASQRSGGQNLGRHLLNAEDNEQVEVHEVSGFLSESVLGAMKEAQAMAMGTRCQQYLFSVSLSPPETESVAVEVFEGAIAKIEERLGLQGQPRVVVFHEKEGRRHAHCVWSRIDAETMTAKQMSHFKSKLMEVSKQLYLENGWKMPKGFVSSQERSPASFTLEEWQQAKRSGLRPDDLKIIAQECWAVSDGRDAFAKAMEERGLYLAKGDRRGHVAVTYEGEVFAISRLVGKTAKEVTAKLGKPDDLRSVDETSKHIAEEITPRLGGYLQEAKRLAHNAMKPLLEQKAAMQKAHADERKKLDAGQKQRWDAETRERAGRLRHGMMGLWDRLTGDYQKTRSQNEREAFFALQRDRQQRQGLIAAQLAERQQLQSQIRDTRHSHARQILELHRQAAHYRLMSDRAQGSERGGERGSGRTQERQRGRLHEQFADAAQSRAQQRGERRQTRERTPERGRDLER